MRTQRVHRRSPITSPRIDCGAVRPPDAVPMRTFGPKFLRDRWARRGPPSIVVRGCVDERARPPPCARHARARCVVDERLDRAAAFFQSGGRRLQDERINRYAGKPHCNLDALRLRCVELRVGRVGGQRDVRSDRCSPVPLRPTERHQLEEGSKQASAFEWRPYALELSLWVAHNRGLRADTVNATCPRSAETPRISRCAARPFSDTPKPTTPFGS